MNRFIDVLPSRIYWKRRKFIYSTSLIGFDPTKTHAYQWADIIHLHWVNAGLLNVAHLSKINKPIVWTIRDMWPMTGGCHYAMECERYKSNCGKCYQLASNFKRDLSYYVLRRKKKYIPRDIKVVGISNWISSCARKSAVFRNHDIRTIHNNVNTTDYYPINKHEARRALGIATNKKMLLVGAQNVNSFYKGFDKFLELLKKLDQDTYYLAFFGRMADRAVIDCGFEMKQFGFLSDTASLRRLYSAADVFIAPSLMDAFGKTLVEAMACGTPVVCFDATGPRDIVEHKQTGYRVAPFDVDDMARGVDWICEDDERWQELSESAHRRAKEKFDSNIIAQQYTELYQELLANGSNR